MISLTRKDHERLREHARAAGFEAADADMRFAELVSQWGKKTDLVKAASVDELIDVLFTDAWILARTLAELSEPPARIVDVGAGAGAPTIPLVLARPGLHATLIEPRRRRVAFMRTAVGALGLRERVEVVEGRLEDWTPQPVDLALSRATFAPDEWLARASEIADRVAVLLAGGDPPAREGWGVEADVEYRTLLGAPRRLRVYRLLRPSTSC